MIAPKSLASLASLLADIPPPPPEIPILDSTLPHPITVAVAGLGVSLAVLFVGLRWKAGKKPALGRLLMSAAMMFAVVTYGAVIWAAGQWETYQGQRETWVPNGPVEDWNRGNEEAGTDSGIEGGQGDDTEPATDTTSEEPQ